ncbi:MAG: hypothetical protein WAW61_22305 [Methylococcaceae bacterium]
MSLYDEIMDLKASNDHLFWIAGFNDSKERAAELAKKYDEEIVRLNVHIAKLTANAIFDSEFNK